jgi:hypothetical protein
VAKRYIVRSPERGLKPAATVLSQCGLIYYGRACNLCRCAQRFSDEVRSPHDLGLPKSKPASKSAVSRSEKLLKLVERKEAHHKDVVESEVEEQKKVIDLMEVLKKGLAGKKAA